MGADVGADEDLNGSLTSSVKVEHRFIRMPGSN